MTVDEVIRDTDLLKLNFDKLVSQLSATAPPDPALKNSLLTMHTTHTFGYEKTFYTDASRTLSHTVYPYRSILIEKRAFLSERYRNKGLMHQAGEQTRKMTKARIYGLDNYVFAYLGLHEYYYAQTDGMNIPAYGAFLSHTLDYEAHANSTLYDLESGLAAGYDPKDITLNTNDARVFTASEITVRYENDLFTYWICPEYADKAFYDDHMWAHKREFHYREKVELADMEAILWPVELVAIDDTDRMVIRADIRAEIAEFRRYNPKVNVYKYIWKGAEGLERFSFASKLVTEYYYQQNEYPGPAWFYDTFTSRFPV